MVMVLAFSRSTVRQTSSGLIRRVSSGKTRVAPWAISMNADHCAAPCMSGGRSINFKGKLLASRSVMPS